MVEFAIVAPLLALLVAGIIEFGTAWRDNLTVTSSTRASARVVTNLSDDRLADYEGLLSLRSGLSTVTGLTIDGVLIYNASAADGAPSADCFTAGGDPQTSHSGECNYYTSAQLASVVAGDFIGTTSCSGAPDAAFCPMTDRETSLAAGVTQVGVWIRVERQWFTDMFPGDGITITDRTVMNIEPET